jgi:DUF1365 family protein
MRERILKIILLVLDRHIEGCCTPVSFYYCQRRDYRWTYSIQ